MIRWTLLLSFLSTLLFGNTKVVVYTDNDYRPYSYFDHGTPKGIQVDIIKEIFSKMRDYHVEILPIKWDDALKKMKNKEILLLNNLYYRTKERPYISHYTTAYTYDTPSLYCNKKIEIKDYQKINWKLEFKGMKIAKQNNFSLPDNQNLHAAIASGDIVLIEDTHQNNISALIEKKIDCYLNEDLFIQGTLLQKNREYSDNNQSTKKLDEVIKLATISREGIHLGFSKKYFSKRKDLLKKINLAIKIMRNSGEIEKITDRYLVEYLTTNSTYKSIDASIYPLGSFVSDKMSEYGILADIVTSAFRDRNISINYHFHDRNEAYLYNKWGKSCMSFPWTKGVDSWLYSELSEPIMTSEINLFYDKTKFPNGIEYDTLYDLKDYHIGGIKGAFYENFFSGMSFDYHSFNNTKALLNALTLKKIDILPMNRHLFVDAIKEYMPHKLDDFSHHEKPMTKKANYILFSKNCRDALFFKEEFNKGFANIQHNGTFDKILSKYTTTNQEKEEFEKIFRNLKEVEKAEEKSVFDANVTEHNLTHSNISKHNTTIKPIIKSKSSQ